MPNEVIIDTDQISMSTPRGLCVGREAVTGVIRLVDEETPFLFRDLENGFKTEWMPFEDTSFQIIAEDGDKEGEVWELVN